MVVRVPLIEKIFIFLGTPTPIPNVVVGIVWVGIWEPQQQGNVERWTFEGSIGVGSEFGFTRDGESQRVVGRWGRIELGKQLFAVFEAGQPRWKGMHAFGSGNGSFSPDIRRVLKPRGGVVIRQSAVP